MKLANKVLTQVNDNIIVHQLLAGRDFAKLGNTNQAHAFAMQMQNFVYVVESVRENACVLIDPAWDVEGILQYLKTYKEKLQVKMALISHRHEDHCGGTFKLGNNTKVSIPGVLDFVRMKIPVGCGRHDLESISKKCGVSINSLTGLKDGDVVFNELKVLETPGHTPGSICFQWGDSFIITGDTLFIQSCGRVDLPESNPNQMLLSLKRLAGLNKEMRVFCGHNYSPFLQSTIGDEVEENYAIRQALEFDEGGKSSLGVNKVAAWPLLPDYLRAARMALREYENSL